MSGTGSCCKLRMILQHNTLFMLFYDVSLTLVNVGSMWCDSLTWNKHDYCRVHADYTHLLPPPYLQKLCSFLLFTHDQFSSAYMYEPVLKICMWMWPQPPAVQHKMFITLLVKVFKPIAPPLHAKDIPLSKISNEIHKNQNRRMMKHVVFNKI